MKTQIPAVIIITLDGGKRNTGMIPNDEATRRTHRIYAGKSIAFSLFIQQGKASRVSFLLKTSFIFPF